MTVRPDGDVTSWPVHPAADLFPLLAGDELASLAADIAANGLHEPVWLYDDPDGVRMLLDGRNRLAACAIAEVDVTTRLYTGDTPTGFVLSENVARRHLTTGQKAAVGFAAMPLFAAEAANRVGGRPRSQRKPEADLPQVSTKAVERDRLRQSDLSARLDYEVRAKRELQSRDRAAKTSGTSGRAVAQYKRLVEHAPDLAAKVAGAEAMPLDRADRIVRDREAEQRRVVQAKAEAAAGDVVASVDLRLGDFREVLADICDADAVITDPPYPAQFLPLLGDLAGWADDVLGPDGVLAVLIGQTYLPEVYRLLDGHRKYRWTGAYLTLGAGYVSHPRKVQSNWKPLLVYGGGPRFVDVVRSEGLDANAKSHHKWGQDYSAFHTIVERLTSRGQTVVDPFMGSGTTLLAAHALGRHVIGCDNDPASVATAKERLL